MYADIPLYRGIKSLFIDVMFINYMVIELQRQTRVISKHISLWNSETAQHFDKVLSLKLKSTTINFIFTA
jgi:hypothetical protein